MQIRPYSVSDVFAITDMIASLAGSAGNELRTLFFSSGTSEEEKEDTRTEAQKEADFEEQGLRIITLVLEKCYAGARPLLIAWFASLCEVTQDAFLKLPPDTVLDVIEQISERKDSRDFFSRACRLFKKIGGSWMPGISN